MHMEKTNAAAHGGIENNCVSNSEIGLDSLQSAEVGRTGRTSIAIGFDDSRCKVSIPYMTVSAVSKTGVKTAYHML